MGEHASANTWHMVLHMVLHPRIEVSCSERFCLMRMTGTAAAECSLALAGTPAKQGALS